MGLRPAEVLDMTAREYAAYAAGVTRRQEAEWSRSLWMAWHIAALTRAKRIPDLKNLMRKVFRRPSKPKTPAELLKIAERINSMMGGEDRRKTKAG